MKRFFRRNEDNGDFFPALLSQKSTISDLMVRQGPQMKNSFQRKPELVKLGTSVSTFTHSCMQKSGLSLLETHPVLSRSGTLRSFLDLLTFNGSLCCPACDCHSRSDSLPAEL